ncbi:hypothetical protein O181_084653 [Austropuccinia psidii MF-1]|uniref:Uncharacterized protein n=1 Tax=Austropuccinia psidii MF-1 TaxID=1389203 RepID=A0A9Q3FRQ6_9BASI|nr:hypothetical protein [Austropuccinia psidii MF-1]
MWKKSSIKKASFHNCGSTYHYSKNCSKAKNKIYALVPVPGEEIQEEESDSDFLDDYIRETSDDNQAPIEEFLVKQQEETQLEIHKIELESGFPKDTPKNNLCKHTQDKKTFLDTTTEGMGYIYGTATNITLGLENSQHQFIIESGANFSIVAKEYL